jgi:dipeptidase D
MSTEMADLVETSTNFATLNTAASTVEILTSQRSSVATKLAHLSSRIEAIAGLAGARVSRDNGYPPWQPDPTSPLLERCKSVFRQTFDADPKVAAIHAGLECALIGDHCPGMQMISFGPTIEDPHSPNERLHLPSVGRTWDFLTALLASYDSDG